MHHKLISSVVTQLESAKETHIENRSVFQIKDLSNDSDIPKTLYVRKTKRPRRENKGIYTSVYFRMIPNFNCNRFETSHQNDASIALTISGTPT